MSIKVGKTDLTSGSSPLQSKHFINDMDYEERQDEVVEFLLYTVRLAKKKTHSNKLPDTVKVKWAKVAVDSCKTLLFSGVLNKRERREVSGFQALFLSVKEKQMENKIPHSTDE